MPLVLPKTKSFAGTDETVFTQENYKLTEPALSYTNVANVQANVAVTASYEDFNQYQIKIVFYASNPVYIPKIKNLEKLFPQLYKATPSLTTQSGKDFHSDHK
jgi:hypothetical protein